MLRNKNDLNQELQPALSLFRENMGLNMTFLDTDAKADAALENGLTSLYARVFAEPPWNETYSDQEVRILFKDTYLKNGLNFTISDDLGQVVAFAVATPANSNKKVAATLGAQLNPDEIMYLADLGVDPTYRRKGLASALTKMRAEAAARCGYRYLAARTAYDNYGQITLMVKNGAVPLPLCSENVRSPGLGDDAPMIKRRYYAYDLKEKVPDPIIIPDCMIMRDPDSNKDILCMWEKDTNMESFYNNKKAFEDTYPLVDTMLFYGYRGRGRDRTLYTGDIAIPRMEGFA